MMRVSSKISSPLQAGQARMARSSSSIMIATSFWKKRNVWPRPSASDTVGFQPRTRSAWAGWRQLRRCSPGRAGACWAATFEPAACASAR